ncbi:aminomethyl-transferring glycine dehydrogenase subunit GcvPB [Oceanithermus sp.]
MKRDFPTLFERSRAGRRGTRPPRPPEVDLAGLLGAENLRSAPPRLPELDELSVVRHYTNLSRRQVGVDTNFYPLGSCTMKYNPRAAEAAAAYFAELHPYQDPETAQGALQIMYELQEYLAEITGMDAVTLQPAAGAHGELTGMLLIRAYHELRGEGEQRRVVLVPDSAHGSNPATASMAGYQVKEVPSGPDGEVDLDALRAALGPEVAAIMLTNPNTLGLFERKILELIDAAHDQGVQLYYDGANLNAIMGWARPGDMGFDVVHLNLHKTFSTPHGGGGPGSGPVGAKAHLAPFLPVPTVKSEGERYILDFDRPQTIGRMRSFYGNFAVMVRAYVYIRMLGAEGLKRASAMAVLNANYLRRKLAEAGYRIPYDRLCKHEFIAQPPEGFKALDVAKALLDYGYHPPTVYFPLIVKEAMMIEPTETESKETLDEYVEAMAEIARRGLEDPEWIAHTPYTTPVRRLDEVAANRKPVLRWLPEEGA